MTAKITIKVPDSSKKTVVVTTQEKCLETGEWVDESKSIEVLRSNHKPFCHYIPKNKRMIIEEIEE